MHSKFNPEEIAFALITLYPNWYPGELKNTSHTEKIRGDLALDFFKKTVRLGYQIVVVDGHSSKHFQEELYQNSHINIIKRRGFKRSPAKRQAFKAASKLPGVKVIIATEAEKVSLLDHIEVITQPILNDGADIVIPERDEGLFKKTYPDYMYELEKEGIKLYCEQLKLNNLLLPNSDNIDLLFGPRVFANTPKVLALFTKKYLSKIEDSDLTGPLDPEELSNALYFPIVMALKKGFKVKSIKIPFTYPKLQKDNETIGARAYFEEKRKTQKLGILLELMHLLNYLKGK